MPWREIKKHPLNFTILFVGLLFFLVLFFFFSYSQYLQRRAVYLGGAFYFLWSLLHHYRKGDLQLSLVLEYLMVALFAALLLTGTLL